MAERLRPLVMTEPSDEDQFIKAVFIHGSPPWRRPPAWENVNCMETWPLKLTEKHEWEAWAVSIRTMCREQGWIYDFNDWDDWLREFFKWYDAEVIKHETQA